MRNFFLNHIGPFLPKHGKMRIFLKSPALPVFSYYESLSSCKKSEKSNKWFLWKTANGQTDRRTEGQTDRGWNHKTSHQERRSKKFKKPCLLWNASNVYHTLFLMSLIQSNNPLVIQWLWMNSGVPGYAWPSWSSQRRLLSFLLNDYLVAKIHNITEYFLERVKFKKK